MSSEPVQSSPSALESKGSRGWIFMLPFFGVAAQHAQAAALGLAFYRPRVKLWFLQDRALLVLLECICFGVHGCGS